MNEPQIKKKLKQNEEKTMKRGERGKEIGG